jgi:O-antigen biosynthesis protein
MNGIVTVAIPVLNGAKYLDEVLSAVREQRVDREVELLIVDSGSTDGSLEIARSHGARIHEIPKSEFSHGGTRNLLMELARGDRVAFLTQDATPASEGWLAALLEGFEFADDVAVVFGPHDVRPGSSHVLEAEMERHFANWGGGREIDVQRLDRSPQGLAAYRAEPWRFSFVSSVNLALARWAWEQVPFREVPYAEDQLLGRELIEAGYAKVFHPGARVIHSHDFPPGRFFRRYFDEYRGLREVLGHREPAGIGTTWRSYQSLVAADRKWLSEHGVSGRDLARKVSRSRRHHAARLAGGILGSRAGRLPAQLRRRLSLEGRDTFKPVDVAPSRLLGDKERVAVDADWGWEFVRQAGTGQVSTDPHLPRPPGGPLRLAWVIPPWRVGSGGHAAIFHLLHGLEELGHKCAVYVFDPFHSDDRPAHVLREEIREHFVPLEAEVFLGLDDFDSADVAIATNWWTAYPVRDLPRCKEKVYLVQDHESEFYPTSVESLWAEQTYGMGYRCLAYTPWLAGVLREQYGLKVAQFDMGTDLETYTSTGSEEREPGLIAVYGRGETSRRAVELVIAGLATLFERRLDHRVVLFGSNFPPNVPFPCENVGVVPPKKLAALYRRASIGLVFSMTNLSLVDQEMMAAGLPVVELNRENVSASLGRSGDLTLLAKPTPEGVADALERLLDHREEAAEMAARAKAFVEGHTWRHAAEQVEAALYDYLARPREFSIGSLRGEQNRVTELLYGRLAEDDVIELEQRIEKDPTAVMARDPGAVRTRWTILSNLWRRTDNGADRKRLSLALGVHYRQPGVLNRTGLDPAQPPEDVHHLGEGPLAAGGSIYHADLVADALAGAQAEPRPGMRILDFGCSSGRVVRVLAAAYPEVEWHGCDPIGPAIEWAGENVPGVEFRASPIDPPLDYPDGFFDAVYAISIWSHFAEGAALRWLEEMHRLICPGGHLVLTSHGRHTVRFFEWTGAYPSAKRREMTDSLDKSGYWYEAVFGEEGDAGVVDDEWGLSAFTPDWLSRKAAPDWRVVEFAEGRNEGNQDVYVLERMETAEGVPGGDTVDKSLTTTREPEPFEIVRADLAARWLPTGSGIEIGALHQPLPVPEGASVKYVDRKTLPELRSQYPELAEYELVEPNIVDDGERLMTLPDASQDFVIANHFIEHAQNPISALANAFRVVRPGGIVFLAVPDKRRTFDEERPLTTIAHLERDYLDGPRWSRADHFEEWARLVDHDENVGERIQVLTEVDYSIHFHVWTAESFKSFLEHCRATHPELSFEIVEFVENYHEFVAILRKTSRFSGEKAH